MNVWSMIRITNRTNVSTVCTEKSDVHHAAWFPSCPSTGVKNQRKNRNKRTRYHSRDHRNNGYLDCSKHCPKLNISHHVTPMIVASVNVNRSPTYFNISLSSLPMHYEATVIFVQELPKNVPSVPGWNLHTYSSLVPVRTAIATKILPLPIFGMFNRRIMTSPQSL
jgi:hypothetical protein